MMERLYEILEDIQPGVNYKECETLVDGHFLDSLSIIALVAELEDEYDITIPAVEIIPKGEYFDYVCKYQKDAAVELCPSHLSSCLVRQQD